jgi:hypothetical protein
VTRTLRLTTYLAAASIAVIIAVGGAQPAAGHTPTDACGEDTTVSGDVDAISASRREDCSLGTADAPTGSAASAGSAGPAVQRVDCGAPFRWTDQVTSGGGYCDVVHNLCQGSVRSSATGQPVTTVGVFENPDGGGWRPTEYNCMAAPDPGPPRVTSVLAWQQVRKLVPRPTIGIAPPGGTSLVNIETVLWVNTRVDKSLGTVRLLGHRVALRIHLRWVEWDFGDGHTDSTSDPGRKYDPDDECRTVLCESYWGHVYETTGPMTISAAVTWSGEFRVDGRRWAPIAGTVTGGAATADLRIRQARGILVPYPSHS